MHLQPLFDDIENALDNIIDRLQDTQTHQAKCTPEVKMDSIVFY